jgi:hypothetical protein
VNHTFSFHDALLYRRAIALLVTIVIALYISFKRYSHDRVLLCEAIGVSIFVVGIILWAIFGFSESSVWIAIASGLAAVFCGLLAVYFGVANWVRRRKLRSQGK